MTTRKIEHVVVLGAGVMGAQIAALLAGVGRTVRLLDMPSAGGAAERASLGLQHALAARPHAFYLPEMAEHVMVGTFNDLECIREADWVIEAVLEEAGAKKNLLAQIEPYIHDGLMISSNTSGLSIAELACDRTSAFRRCFFGVHFFNPPRYMNLVELIPSVDTEPELLEVMHDFLENELGKGVVRGRDTPNFIGNRMWIFAACDMLQRMQRFDLTVAEVDVLTGPLMGRPKSGTLRVCDIVGLDTVAHVAHTSYTGLQQDPWRDEFLLPAFYGRMLQEELLGAKVNAGFYRKGEVGIEAIDIGSLVYQPIQQVNLGPLQEVLRERSAAQRLQMLWQDTSPQGHHARQHLLAVLAYAAENAAEMAGDIVAVDQAMRWGFNWDLGPFEIWDLIGVGEIAQELEKEQQAVPDFVGKVLGSRKPKFYNEVAGAGTSFSPVSFQLEPWQPLLGDEVKLDPERASWSNGGAYLVELQEGLGALVFSGKMNALGPASLEAVHHAVESAPYTGLVLCGAGGVFSVGADLKHMAGLVDAEDWSALEAFVGAFQMAVQALRRAPFPVVAAVQGLALGGGCEFSLATDARVAAAELRMGLVETKVGLIPGSGGCMEMARRGSDDILPAFNTVFTGGFSSSAFQARAWRMLDAEDEIVHGQGQLLPRAVSKLQELLFSNYVPSDSHTVRVAGDDGLALLQQAIEERLKAGLIGEHDAVVGRALARVMVGGVGAARAMEEQAMLDLEREVFMELCATEMTRARIEHMLKTGKPLRN